MAEWMPEFNKCMIIAVNNSKEEWMNRGMRGPTLYQQCQETCEAICKAYNVSANAAGWPRAFPVKGEYIGPLDELYVRRWKADSVTDGGWRGSGRALDLHPGRKHVWIVLVNGNMPLSDYDAWYNTKVHEVDPTAYQFKDQFNTVWSPEVTPGDNRIDWIETVRMWSATPIKLGIVS